MLNYSKLKYKKTLLFFFILSLFSLFQSSLKALKDSCDFQWFPSKLLSQGINHYKYFLEGGETFKCQLGEYAHGLQVVLLPFAYLEWSTAKIIWLFINLFLVFTIPLMLCKKFYVSDELTVLILCIFITCSPTRNAINLGQQSLFTMFFFILPFLIKNNYSYFFSGFSYFKYSVGSILAFYYLICKKYKLFLFSIIPSLLGWIIYFIMTNSDPITNLFEPLKLILGKNYLKTNDLYSLIIQIYIFDNYDLKETKILHESFKLYTDTSFVINKLIGITIFLSLTFVFIKMISNIENELVKLSILCLIVLVFLPHARYDYILLLPLLILSLKNFKYIIFKFNFGVIIYYFYFNRFIKHFIGYDQVYEIAIFLIFFIQLIVNLIYLRGKNNLILK